MTENERYNNILMRHLHSLTPGGSEFAGDPEHCVAYIKKRLDNEMQLMKDKEYLRRALRKCRDALVPKDAYVAEDMQEAYQAAIRLVGEKP